MKKNYIVHGISSTQVPSIVTIDGAEVEAMVSSVHLELIPENGIGSAIQLPVIAREEKSTIVDFEVGMIVAVTFEKAE